MEPPALTCPPSPARDQPAPAASPAGAPGGQASPGLTLGPVILPPPEPGLAPALLLKALPVPLYHMVPPGGLQPRAPLLPGSLEGGGAPFLLSPLLPPEGPGAAQGKRGAPTLTVNLVGALPVLSPGPGPPLGSPGRARGAGRHLCPHCGRDCGKPSVLEKHIRSHTGERPFPCASCGIAFKTQSNLYKHRRTQTHLGRSRARPDAPASPRPAPAAARRDPGDQDPPAEAAAPGDEEDLAPRRKLPEQKPPAAGRPGPPPQPWEKAGDARAPEGRLRKCESTDSGYLSRSDSAEQPPAPGSPLPSAEPDGEGAAGGAPRGPGLALEKRQLEERIARLISHNQAVVADPQLDHVRPRRSLLGPQGSLDLAPGAFRGSFHVAPREPRRCLAPARSALGPPERARPLFFHSVPTQLSTSAECVPVTRSNSLPAVEGARTWPEPSGPRSAAPRGDRLLSPRPGPAAAGLGGRLALTVVAVPSGHPRALVRQAAVEDLPGPPEEPEGPRAEGGGPAAGRARGAKRAPARRSQMFSQEKWQVYGRDTFQKLYQKTSSGRPGGGGARGAPGQGGVSVRVQPGPRGPSPAPGTVLVAESPTRGDTGARAGGADESGGLQATALPTLSCQEAPGVGQRDLLPAGADPRRVGSPGQCGGRSGGPPAVEGSPLETKRVKVEAQSGPGCLGAGAPARGSPHRQDTPSSGNKEPPLCPEAARPQLAAPPGAPSVLTAPSEPPFPPKYLLRLPHGEAPGGAHPASGGSRPGTSGFKETPSWSRSGERRKGELQGDGRGCGGTPPTPEAGDCPREGAALPPTPTWDPRGAKSTKGGACGVPGGGRDCAGGRPRAPSRERGSSLEDPSQASEGPRAAPASPAHSSGTAGGHGAPFPSLRAEPQLTWCCLHRSLPLALEQRDSGASAYLAPPPALATPGGSPGPQGQTQPPASQLPCPPAPGAAAQPWAPERDRKDSRHQGSTKRTRGNSQQHRSSSTAKRYKGTLCPSRAQLRAGRLRRAHLARRRERRGPGPPGTGPRRTPAPAACRRAGRPVRGEPPASALAAPPAGGKQEKADQGPPLTSERFVPRPSSRTAKVAPKDIPPSADGFAGPAPQDSPGGSGSSLPPHPCVDTASLLLRGKRPDPGLTPTQPPCPERGPPAAPPCTSAATPGLCLPESDAPPEGSLRREAGPQDRDATTEAGPASPGPQRGPRPSLGAASGQAARDTPDPQESRLEPPLSPTGQARRRADSGEARGVVQPPGPVAPKLPADTPEALPRAPKRRSLEGMRKQRRVEPSDSSSDDEDRLVIEL